MRLNLGSSDHYHMAMRGGKAPYRERQDERHSGQKAVWRRLVVGENLELKADFPSVLQCDFSLCDLVKQLDRRRRRRVIPLSSPLWDAASILTKMAGQTCLTDMDFSFHDVDAANPHSSITERCPLGQKGH